MGKFILDCPLREQGRDVDVGHGMYAFKCCLFSLNLSSHRPTLCPGCHDVGTSLP